MNKRLQKKCFIASTGVHLLLVIILLVGPALMSSSSKPVDLGFIDFVPSKLIDAPFSGGGNPNVAKPRPVAVAPAPKPQSIPEPAAPKHREPDPPKTTPKTQKPDSDSLETKTDSRHKPDVSTKLVTRKTKTTASSKSDSDAEEKKTQAREQASRLKAASQITSAAARLSENLSGVTSIEGDYGPGGGGPAYANYAAWVKTCYQNAWEPPEDSETDNAITKVTVTISSTGEVISAHISRASGDAPVDNSVRRTLDKVTSIGKPFPEGAKEKQRTYIINFNLKAKRGMA